MVVGLSPVFTTLELSVSGSDALCGSLPRHLHGPSYAILPPFGRADNWSIGHVSWVKWVNKSGWVTCVTCDPLTH